MTELEPPGALGQTGQPKREIIFAWNYVEWGGVQIYFLGIMRFAKAQGFALKAVMPKNSEQILLDYFRAENFPVSLFNAQINLSPPKNVWDRIGRRCGLIRTQWVLGRHLRKQDLPGKIVQIDVGVRPGFWLLLYLSLRTNVFVTMHSALFYNPKSPRHWIVKLKYRLLMQLPTFHLLASNNDMKLSLRPVVPDQKWRQIPVAYTGVNAEEIKQIVAQPCSREELLTKYNLPNNKIFVFALGHILELKGFRVFLKMAQKSVETHKNLFFVWVGDGADRTKMLDLIDECNLREMVKVILPLEFAGHRASLLQLLRLADIFAHPSFVEGLPGSMLEAMALGKPVVASRVNAIPECVIEGENGFLIKAGDVEGFSAAVEKLADDAILRENFGTNAQNQVLNNFTEERCAKVTIDFYEQCLNAGRLV